MRYRMKELYAGAAKPAAKTEVEDEAKAGTTESPKKSQESDGANADCLDLSLIRAAGAHDKSQTESDTMSEMTYQCEICGSDIWQGTISLCKNAWRCRASGFMVYADDPEAFMEVYIGSSEEEEEVQIRYELTTSTFSV